MNKGTTEDAMTANTPIRQQGDCAWWELDVDGPVVIRWEDGDHELFADRDIAEQRWTNMVYMARESAREATGGEISAYELEAWIGDARRNLTADQFDELLTIARQIQGDYPDLDDGAERDAALTAAYRLMVDPLDEVLVDLAGALADSRSAESAALAGLRQAARSLIVPGKETEQGFARKANIDRMTVRKWLGKR